MDEVAVRADPHRGRVPAQVGREVGGVDDGAIDDVAGDADVVADRLRANRRLDAVAADQRDAAVAAAAGIEDDDAVLVFLEAGDPRRGDHLDPRLRAHALEQRQVDVGAVDDGVRVGEARPERRAGRDLADQRLVDRVHHHHPIGVDGAAARALADAERVEGGERVRRELDAGADLADLRRLLEDDDAKAALRERQRRGEAADAGTGDDDRVTRARHGSLCVRRRHAATPPPSSPFFTGDLRGPSPVPRRSAYRRSSRQRPSTC